MRNVNRQRAQVLLHVSNSFPTSTPHSIGARKLLRAPANGPAASQAGNATAVLHQRATHRHRRTPQRKTSNVGGNRSGAKEPGVTSQSEIPSVFMPILTPEQRGGDDISYGSERTVKS